jgi:hypothetical protein
MDYGIKVSQAQLRKLKKGGAVTLKGDNFDDSSPNRIMVMPNTARRINTAVRRNKGVRIALKPDEDLVAMTEGGKVSLKGTVFDRRFKTPKELREDFGINAMSKGAKQTAGVVKRGFKDKIVDSGVGKDIASQLIRTSTGTLLPATLGFASQIMGDPTGISGNVVGSIAGDQLQKLAEKRGYGVRARKAKNTLKAIGRVAKKIQKNPMVKELEKQALREGAKVAGEALSAYTGNPAAGMTFERVVVSGGDKLIDSGSGKQALKSSGKQASRIALEMVDDYVDNNLSGVEKEVVENALAGRYPYASDLIYDYGSKKLDMYGNEMFGSGIVPRRGRGGLCMRGGRMPGSMMDKKRAVNMIQGSGFRVADDRVTTPAPTISSVIQLGSPYQRINSAAMSPFIPSSPQLAGRMSMSGGSFLTAGSRMGGSFLPA